MGGSLVVKDREDGVSGVCFCLMLPLELPMVRVSTFATPGLAAAAAAAAATPVAMLRFHVLVVDDSATNRRVAERVLRALGCTSTLCEDGDEVPDAVAREHFDVLMLDIRMARVNGDAACASLRAGGYTGPIIAVTGNATRADAEDYARVGFDATLGKPFDAAGLRACIASAVAGAARPAAHQLLPEKST